MQLACKVTRHNCAFWSLGEMLDLVTDDDFEPAGRLEAVLSYNFVAFGAGARAVMRPRMH